MLTHKKGTLLILGLLGVIALFAACKAPSEEVAKPGEGTPLVLPTATPLGAEVKPIPGGILRGYYTADPAYWSPLMGTSGVTTAVAPRVHTTLIQFYFGKQYPVWNFDIDAQNSLATSWEISADGLTYTFHLRQGVKWQNKPPVNGREFVAEDVKWSYETHMATAGAPRREQLSAAIESITCPDKYTVVIKLKEPRAEFILLIAGSYVLILPPEIPPKDMNKPEALVGLGPFLFEEWVPNVRYTFKKNPTYYRAVEGLPYLDGMHYINIPDSSTSLAAFRAEKVDIRAISRIDLASVYQTNPDMYCYENELTATVNAIAFRTDKAPFSDVNVRRAVSMAIDRKAIIDAEYLGYGVEQLGPIHVAAPWYLKDLEKEECAKYYRYNPEEARSLLAAAGYPAGLSVDLVNYAGTTTPELIKDFLDKVGLKTTLKPLESAAFIKAVYTGINKEYDPMVLLTILSGASYGPDIWLNQLYGWGYSSNYSMVNDAVAEPLMKAQTGEMDPMKRQGIINELQRHLICQVYYVHWPLPYYVTCLQPWVRNYAPHAASFHTGRIGELIWLTEDAPGRK